MKTETKKGFSTAKDVFLFLCLHGVNHFLSTNDYISKTE